MKIVINAFPLLSPLTGVGNYIYQIARLLPVIDTANDYTYYYGYYSKKLFTYKEDRKLFYNVKEVVKGIPVIGKLARELKDFNVFSKRPFDLYFEPDFIPVNINARKTVVTVFDFSWKLYPEWHPRDRVDYFENNFWKKIKKADQIIVISNYIRESAVELFGFPEEKLKSIHLGFDKSIFKKYESQELQHIKTKYELPDNFILVVGSIEPRKNLKNLIRSYIGLNKEIRKNFKVVIVGFKGWENKEVMELLKQAETDVSYLGYIPDTDLGKIYNLATLFVYPSFYEGFGLPPLEAMACGCPVVVSNVASLPEVCGDAAYYVDPDNAESITDGIYRVLTDSDLRQNLINKGLERSKLFSWENSAREHRKVFEDILK